MNQALALLRRDIVLAWREGAAIGTALGFYLVVVAITPNCRVVAGPRPR